MAAPAPEEAAQHSRVTTFEYRNSIEALLIEAPHGVKLAVAACHGNMTLEAMLP